MSITFIIDPISKKFRTGVSLRKVLNPQQLSSIVPHTLSMVQEAPIIHIQNDLEPNTHPSTIITKYPPSPPKP
jgi:hypothetical protein